MSYVIQFRRGTAAQWAATTRPLAAGEAGVELDGDGDVVGWKLGTGTDLWAALPYEGGDGAGLAAHIDEHGAGAHLPEGGSFGQIPYRTSGDGVAWGDPPEGGGGGGGAGTSIAVMDYDDGASSYVAVGGVNPATAALRWWRGPVPPKDADGGEEWALGDLYSPTAI